MELLDDFWTRKPKRANEKRAFLVSYVKNADLVNVIPLLKKRGIDFRIEKVINKNTTTILPIPSTQLEQLDSLIYVTKEEFLLASQLIKTYIAPTKEIENKEEQIAIRTTTNWTLLFPILGLLVLFLAQPLWGILSPLRAEVYPPYYFRYSCFGFPLF